MARLYTSGDESGNLAAEWSTWGGNAVQITGAAAHTGNYGTLVDAYGPLNEPYVRRNLTPAPELFMAFWVYISGTGTGIFSVLCQSGTLVSFSCGADGSIAMSSTFASFDYTTAPGFAVIPCWMLFEVHGKIGGAGAGQIEVRLDGQPVRSVITDTSAGLDIRAYQIGTNYRWIGMDDRAINDPSGATDNSWVGDLRIIALAPNGAGTYTQLTPTAGANWQCVDERPQDDDTSYVASSTVDQRDTYALAASGLVEGGVSIRRVWESIVAREDSAGGAKIAALLRTNGSDVQGVDQAINTSYVRYAGPVYPLNPVTGVAWTVAEVDALEAGEVVR